MIVDERGDTRAIAQAPIPITYPFPGWVNQDANAIWRVTKRVALEVIADAALPPGAIEAIGITNQRETTVLWDRVTGDPVAPAIVWQSAKARASSSGLSRPVITMRS